mmetsp:Transcript_13155/g.14805  ORF Transcript_13155/g.14805 Transcript_13155/m.14805 type:complete len:123 (+) Transcript_13155:806-1174(+)
MIFTINVTVIPMSNDTNDKMYERVTSKDNRNAIRYATQKTIPEEMMLPQIAAPSRNDVLSKSWRYFLKYGSLKLAISPLLNFNVVIIIDGMVDEIVDTPTRKTQAIPTAVLKSNIHFFGGQY